MFAFPKPLRDPADLKAGDIIGFSGDAWLSAGIALATFGVPWWSLSHVGIMGEHDGRLLLFESTTLNSEPCCITGKCIEGSQAHPLDETVARYPGKVWHYPIYRALFPHERERLNDFLLDTLGEPYDQIGAFRAGGFGFSWLESRLRESDLASLFCSEWCAAAHAEIGLFATDNVSRWNPSFFVRTERRQGILRKPRRMK
jgi:hypothetical protein